MSAKHAIAGKIRLYDKMFLKENPINSNGDFIDNFNKNSVKCINNAKLEDSLLSAKKYQQYQFLRKGYFVIDKTSTKRNLIFNQTVNLKNTWAKKNKSH